MSEQSNETTLTDEEGNTQADLRVGIVIFCTAVVMAIHFVSGFTF